MKKLYSRKLAVALALASLFGVKPASGLNNLAKVAIPVALVGLVSVGGFLIHHLLKKESGGDKGNKETKPVKINQKGQYYDENIKMITENDVMDKEQLDKFIGFINSKNNDFLGEIVCILSGGEHYFKNFNGFSYDGVEWREHWKELDANVIAAKGVTKGSSWVEKFFDDLRGNMKIEKLERNGCNDCFITIGGSRFWINFGNDSFTIERNSEGAVDFKLRLINDKI